MIILFVFIQFGYSTIKRFARAMYILIYVSSGILDVYKISYLWFTTIGYVLTVIFTLISYSVSGESSITSESHVIILL